MKVPATSITQSDADHSGDSLVIESASRFPKDLEEGALWTAQRLKQALLRHLPGERVLVVANREPYILHAQARRKGRRCVVRVAAHPVRNHNHAGDPVPRQDSPRA